LLDLASGKGVVTQSIFEDAITACSQHGKWRKAVDVMEKMHSKGVPVSEATMNAAIHGCCVGSSASNRYNGLSTAMSLFHDMKIKQFHCKLPVYASLLTKLSSAGLASEFDMVWSQLEASGFAVSDAMYGLRAEVLGLSSRIKEANAIVDALSNSSGLLALLTAGKLRGLLRCDDVNSAEKELRLVSINR